MAFLLSLLLGLQGCGAPAPGHAGGMPDGGTRPQLRADLEQDGQALPVPDMPELPPRPAVQQAPPPAHPPPPRPDAPPSSAPVPGEPAFAVESVRCEGAAGIWSTVLEGTVTALEGNMVQVRLSRRLGVKYNPAEKGIDETDWYCIPRRRYCYASVGFSDWGGRYREGETASFPLGRTFHKRTRLVNGITPILRADCR